jgi:hypothetical protein
MYDYECMTMNVWLYDYDCITVWLWLYDYECMTITVMTENKLETNQQEQQQQQQVEKWYLEPPFAVKNRNLNSKFSLRPKNKVNRS